PTTAPVVLAAYRRDTPTRSPSAERPTWAASAGSVAPMSAVGRAKRASAAHRASGRGSRTASSAAAPVRRSALAASALTATPPAPAQLDPAPPPPPPPPPMGPPPAHLPSRREAQHGAGNHDGQAGCAGSQSELKPARPHDLVGQRGRSGRSQKQRRQGKRSLQ